ncbi:MAG: hypothetical protein OHK0017_07550 [Patescibacteria group bacterium]
MSKNKEAFERGDDSKLKEALTEQASFEEFNPVNMYFDYLFGLDCLNDLSESDIKEGLAELYDLGGRLISSNSSLIDMEDIKSVISLQTACNFSFGRLFFNDEQNEGLVFVKLYPSFEESESADDQTALPYGVALHAKHTENIWVFKPLLELNFNDNESRFFLKTKRSNLKIAYDSLELENSNIGKFLIIVNNLNQDKLEQPVVFDKILKEQFGLVLSAFNHLAATLEYSTSVVARSIDSDTKVKIEQVLEKPPLLFENEAWQLGITEFWEKFAASNQMNEDEAKDYRSHILENIVGYNSLMHLTVKLETFYHLVEDLTSKGIQNSSDLEVSKLLIDRKLTELYYDISASFPTLTETYGILNQYLTILIGLLNSIFERVKMELKFFGQPSQTDESQV